MFITQPSGSPGMSPAIESGTTTSELAAATSYSANA
jgi:hypothetical protein